MTSPGAEGPWFRCPIHGIFGRTMFDAAGETDSTACPVPTYQGDGCGEPVERVRSGEAQEPSEEAASSASQVRSAPAQSDRPREPSPELRERVAKAIERAYNEFDLSAFSKLDDRFWPEAADAVLAALREEQGR